MLHIYPCVWSFTSPGIDTRQKGPPTFSVSSERHRHMWGEWNWWGWTTFPPTTWLPLPTLCVSLTRLRRWSSGVPWQGGRQPRRCTCVHSWHTLLTRAQTLAGSWSVDTPVACDALPACSTARPGWNIHKLTLLFCWSGHKKSAVFTIECCFIIFIN